MPERVIIMSESSLVERFERAGVGLLSFPWRWGIFKASYRGTYEDNVAPHWDKSYFEFDCDIVYNETVVAANAVAPIAVTTDFNLYRLDNAPIDVAWPIVKAVNHHHLFGDFRLAFGLIAIRNHAIVDKNT